MTMTYVKYTMLTGSLSTWRII